MLGLKVCATTPGYGCDFNVLFIIMCIFNFYVYVYLACTYVNTPGGCNALRRQKRLSDPPGTVATDGGEVTYRHWVPSPVPQ